MSYKGDGNRMSMHDNHSLTSEEQFVSNVPNGPNRNGQVMMPSLSGLGGSSNSNVCSSSYVPIVHALNWGLAHCAEHLMQVLSTCRSLSNHMLFTMYLSVVAGGIRESS